ncbi:DMT family transporter [Anaeroselena agilis]|uniref:DMT family transporter n=1 Tax=Anaeroselena agilis TaxID=3063788 RepID=A0ABU3NWW1_9FIRM|nr:DMT family transporter [Selenomonadales bacterium 4137-cl]
MRHSFLIELLLWLVVLIWAGNYTIGKFGMREFSPLLFTALRFTIATPLILLLLHAREGGLRFSRAALPRVILVGVVGIAFYQTAFIAAVKYTTVATVSLALGVSPIFTALLGAALGREKLTRPVLAGCLTAFAGLFLVISQSPGAPAFGLHTPIGDLLALAAGLLWGLYPILATPLLKTRSALWVTGHSSLAGTAVLLALAAPELLAADWAAVTWAGWASLLYAAVPVTVIALVGWYHAIEKIGANQVMIYMYLITPVAITIAAFTIGEKITLLQGIGAAVAMAGVFLAKRSSA